MLDPQIIKNDVCRALTEDIGDGDLTASLIPADTRMQTRVISRQSATLAGSDWFNQVFAQISSEIDINWLVADGDQLVSGQELCRINGPARGILSGERTGLNFLQTLSATATSARAFVDAISATKAIILDTRKTIPGLRMAQKYAARCGGASNHRHGLYDAILIKENHINAAGSIAIAVSAAQQMYPDLLLEVEVESLDELKQAVDAGAQRALLDNFDLNLLVDAVSRYHARIELEASGNVNLQSVRAIAETGVDYISTGAITKNIQAVDLSMLSI